MTANAVRRPRRRSDATDPEPTVVGPRPLLAIGEIDQTVFDCPSCSRPLAMGTRRCPGCRTRLVLGIPLSKASTFAAVGLALGVAIGGAGGVAFGLTRGGLAAGGGGLAVGGVGAGDSGRPAASVAPSAAPRPTPTMSAPPAATDPGGVPLINRSAILQTVAINARLAAASRDLSVALATKPFDASAVAQTLRGISADSVYAGQLATIDAAWPPTSAAGSALRSLYAAAHESASAALGASVRNEAAYRDAARAMILLLADVSSTDAGIRSIAAAQGIVLPESSTAP